MNRPILLMPNSSSATENPLPPMFARPTQLIGWQGCTLHVPADWNFVQFGGNHAAGHFSLADDDGPRLEARWEVPQRAVDIQKSVDDFVKRIGGEVKKKKQPFEPQTDIHLLSAQKKRKPQLASFGWKSAPTSVVGQGYGVAWQCEHCKRVLVAQLIGRGNERGGKLQNLASEIFASMECHGSGGWETWSLFGLRVEVPEEFELAKAKLLVGRLELEWSRGAHTGLMAMFKRDERLALSRYSAANIVLRNETLAEWTRRVAMPAEKRYYYRALQEAPLPGSPALQGKPPRDVSLASRVLSDEENSEETQTTSSEKTPSDDTASDETTTPDDANGASLIARGFLRDFRRVALLWLSDKVARRPLVAPELRVWHSESVNKIFVLKSELSANNAHILGDVVDSLESS